MDLSAHASADFDHLAAFAAKKSLNLAKSSQCLPAFNCTSKLEI